MPYRTQSPDTHPAAERILIEGFRRMSPAEKIARLQGLVRFARHLELAAIRERHPAVGERELSLRLASRTIPADLMRRAFDWDPEREGY